jgi:long-chain acyl-CoA synthetase
VGLHLPNTPHFVIFFFAVLMAGGRVVNFSPLAAPRELKYQLIDAETQVMITLGLPMLYPQIAALNGTGKFQTLVVCKIEDFIPGPIARAFGPAADRIGGVGREIEFASLIDNDGAFKRHPHKSLEDDVAVLQYTGGTTGEPKGAMLTHANFCAVLNIYNHWDHPNVSRGEEKTLAVLPLFHIFGLTFIMLLAVAHGEQVVLHIKFDPDRALADISRKKITVFLGVPMTLPLIFIQRRLEPGH